jgi:putative redox protein
MEIKITFPGGKRVNASFDDFEIKTDQSVKDGGDESAPSPFATFLASLGTCAGIYVLSYLEARKLPTEGVEIVQSHEADAKTGKLSKVSLRIVLPEGIAEKHLGPIKRAASLCAVKKLIENPPEFEILTSQ